MVVYDVGVHKAFFALLAAKCVGKAGRVVGFEPNPLNFDIAVQNLELSPDLAGVVTLRKKAVSNTCGTAVFNVKKRGASSGKIVRESDANGATMTEVESVTLDSVIKTDRLPVPDLIKIDIEGEEEFALAGMKETIATARPTIVIEVHDEPSWTAFLAAMDEQGYRWWQIMDDGELVRRPQGWEYRSHYLAMPADQDESPLRSSRGRN
jgi:FkbM family methyltransferase